MKLGDFGLNLEQNYQDGKSLLKSKRRRIILDRYAVPSYLDEFEDHCLTLKNAPHQIISCAAYETLVNEEDQACSTPDTPHYTSDIRRITIKTSPDTIQDTQGHAPHKDSRYAASEYGV